MITPFDDPPCPTIVFVAHGGPLEVKSALLAASLFLNYRPKKISCCLMEPISIWGKISSETATLFEQLQIDIHYAKNEVDTTYAHGNKIGSMAKIDGPAIFLDSDMFMMRPFSWHYKLAGDFAAKPADLDTYSRGGGAWSAVYDLFDLEMPTRKYTATTTGELIRPYFNAGFIYVKNARVFTEAWVEASCVINKAQTVKNKNPWLDQVALPVAVELLNWETEILDDQFNFPCHIQSPVDVKPYFVHYHWPKVINGNSVLKEEYKKLLDLFPLLRTISGRCDEWDVLNG